MCVAVLVESECPTYEELRWMEIENPHGAGIAWGSGNHVRYRKGLTAGQIFALAKTLPRPFLLHFRWATHGPKVPRLAHPFPLGFRAITSESLRGRAPAVLIHNGIWNDHAKHAPAWIKAYPETSDTAIAALAAATNEDILDDVKWATAVGRAAGNGRMDVTLRGNWEEYNGNLYSNFNWKPRAKWGYYPDGYSGNQTGWAFNDDSIAESWAEWSDRQDRRDMVRESVRGYLAGGVKDRGYMNRGRIMDSWPNEVEDLSPDPIGMTDTPEETPVSDATLLDQIRDQLLLDQEPVRIPANGNRFFDEHAEVQAALAKIEGVCPIEECVLPHGHKGGHFNADNRLVGFTTSDGRFIGWNRDGRMKHLKPAPEQADKGCE